MHKKIKLPILDWKEDKKGNRFDYSLIFLSEQTIKILLGSLIKERLILEQLSEDKSIDFSIFQIHLSNINSLIETLSQYEPKKA